MHVPQAGFRSDNAQRLTRLRTSQEMALQWHVVAAQPVIAVRPEANSTRAAMVGELAPAGQVVLAKRFSVVQALPGATGPIRWAPVTGCESWLPLLPQPYRNSPAPAAGRGSSPTIAELQDRP